MGGWKRTVPTCYVVSWPDGVVKVGYSERQRWRAFVLRGARLHALYMFATTLESFLQDRLGESHPKAFTAAADASRHLGTSGGGWLECYRTQCVTDAVASCIRIADAYMSGNAYGDARTDVRNGRTNGDGVRQR